ncbi:MAG: hypothetical protein AAF845_16525 [Bacteroidota bacterium]
MIRHVSTRREDRVTDAVGCARAFGLPFLVTGSFCLAAALGGMFGVEGGWDRLGVGVIGAGHLGAGLALWLGRWTGAVVRRRGVEWTERRLFRAPVRREIAPSEVDRVEVEEDTDSDGDDIFRVALRLRSGERLPLTRQYVQVRAVADEAALAVARRLQIPDRIA